MHDRGNSAASGCSTDSGCSTADCCESGLAADQCCRWRHTIIDITNAAVTKAHVAVAFAIAFAIAVAQAPSFTSICAGAASSGQRLQCDAPSVAPELPVPAMCQYNAELRRVICWTDAVHASWCVSEVNAPLH